MPRILQATTISVLLSALASCNSAGPISPDPGSPPVEALGIPGVEFSPASIAFPGGSNRASLVIANVGSAALDWKVKTVTAPWVSVSPSAGALTPGTSAAVTVAVDRDKLSPGNHSAAISIMSGSRMSVLTVRVSDAPPSANTAALEPASLTLGPSQASGEVEVVNRGTAPLDWTLTGPFWVNLARTAGRLDRGARIRVVVTPDRSRMSPGRNTGVLTLAWSGGSAAATLSVDVDPPSPSTPARLRLGSSTLSFGETTSQLSLDVLNEGGQTLNWTVTAPPWATVHPASGQVAAGERGVVVVAPDRSKLTPGSHSGALSFSSNGGAGTVAISVDVPTGSTPSSPRLRLDPGAFDFGSQATQRSLTIVNDGDATLNWSAQPSSGWISLAPSAGQVPARSSATATVQISRSGLSAGTHEGSIRFTSNGGNATVRAVAKVNQAADLRVSRASLDFGTTGTQLSLQIFNDGGQPLEWSAQASWGWISVTPSTGRVPADSSTTLTVQVSRNGLSGGNHEGTIQFTSNGGSATVTTKVTVVRPPTIRVSQTALDFGSATALSFRVFNDGGEPLDWSARTDAGWLRLSPSSGRVPAGSSQEVQVQALRADLPVGDHVASVELSSNGGSATLTASIRVASDGPSGEVNVRDFGAKGDGVTDDIAAFEAALDALGPDGGTLLVPAGTYIVNPSRKGALEITRRSNITLAGEGLDRSIIRLAPVSYGTAHVILVTNASGITIRDLTLDGNVPNATFNEPQCNGIEVRNSSDVRVERMRFMRIWGDGVRLIGHYHDAGPWTERVVVANSHFEDTGRSGVGMQRAVQQVQILNNTFERVSDQSLSSEPGGKALGFPVGPRDIVMENNVIRHFNDTDCVALQGPSVTDRALRVVFRNNRMENCSVKFRSMDGLLIEGNTIVGDRYTTLSLPSVSNVQIVDNEISGPGGGDGLVEVTAQYDITNPYPSAFSSHIVVRNNRIRPNAGQPGLRIGDALSDVVIEDNTIDGTDHTGILIFNRFVGGALRSGFTIRGNVVRNFHKGIVLSTRGDRYAAVVIEANDIDHDQMPATAAVGILFSETGHHEAFATLTGNRFGTGIVTPILVSDK
jgi:polygalacturonase